MFEKSLMKFQSHKKSYDVNIQTISAKLDIANAGKEKTNSCGLKLRHVVALVGFFTCFLQNANRLVLSVAIVAMVKHSERNETSHRNDSEISCPLPSVPPKLPIRSNFQGEFDWSTELQGYVIGAGFLSYLFTQIPAGRLTDAVGAKSLLVYSNAVSGILTLISPFAARWHVYALIAAQFLRGASQGFTTPAIYKLISNWIPRDERGTLSTLIVCGYGVGAAVAGIVTGWLSDISGLGWPSAFYAWGIISLLIAAGSHCLYYEYPEKHPWISIEELNYLRDVLESKASKKQPPTPWKKMFSTATTYAYFYGFFGFAWSIAYFLSVHPAFMGTVLHFAMTENGITSCLPVLSKSIGGVFASIACHWISKKNLIGLSNLRKITTIIGSFGFSVCTVGVLLAECNAFLNILCFTLSLFTSGIALSGIMISGVDMAPAFAGSLMGVASTIGGLSTVLIPIITGLVTTHETLSEWRIVFWINLGIVSSSGIVYVLFGSAEIQPWNYPERESSESVEEGKKSQSDKNLNDKQMKEKLEIDTE